MGNLFKGVTILIHYLDIANTSPIYILLRISHPWVKKFSVGIS